MNLSNQLGEWYPLLKEEFTKPYLKKINRIIRGERSKFTVYPKSEDVFKAYRLTPPNEVKVVIIGQDPYPHDAANGLCFSCYNTKSIPASLRNIFRELKDDTGIERTNTELDGWAKQGVLMLNTTLTTRAKAPGSHSKIGWNIFTSKTLKILSEQFRPIVFILWGSDAQNLGRHIEQHHFKLYAPHPSPLSAYRGFFGCKHFSETNRILEKYYNYKIDWNE